jgi:hypothetical protein
MKCIISVPIFLAGSGKYRLFTNEHRNGSRTELRAETPYTSPPLDDDFDAITQRWSGTTRTTTVEPTSSGLYEQLEAVTRTTTPAVAGFTTPRRRKKKAGHDVGDWVSRENKTGDLSAVVTQGRSLRRTRGKDRIKSANANGSVVPRSNSCSIFDPTHRRARSPPLAGQDYEMVEYRVLEEGTDRTVSISTWREQAIQETNSDDDMSIYYMNPQDCVQFEDAEIGVPLECVSHSMRTKGDYATGSNNAGRMNEMNGLQVSKFAELEVTCF